MIILLLKFRYLDKAQGLWYLVSIMFLIHLIDDFEITYDLIKGVGLVSTLIGTTPAPGRCD